MHSHVSAELGFLITLLPILQPAGGSTDYEVRTAPKGAGGPAWSANVRTALQLAVVPAGQLSGLRPGQTYYIRARFVDTTLGDSEWSDDQRVTT